MNRLPFAGATVVSVFASSPEPWDAESSQMDTAKKKKAVASQAPQPQASLVITGDFIVTALWVFVSSTFAEAAKYLSAVVPVEARFIGIAITLVALIAFGPVCNMFGGAIFNPVHNIAFMASGKDTMSFNLQRMASQFLGALVGSIAAVRLIPVELQESFVALPGGVKAGVALELGFACEALLGFLLNLIVLYSGHTHNKLLGYWTPILACVPLTLVGQQLTGPSLNPFISFSWYWHFQVHSAAEHILVYWVAPFSGALLAGAMWRRHMRGAKARRTGTGRASPVAAAGGKQGYSAADKEL